MEEQEAEMGNGPDASTLVIHQNWGLGGNRNPQKKPNGQRQHYLGYGGNYHFPYYQNGGTQTGYVFGETGIFKITQIFGIRGISVTKTNTLKINNMRERSGPKITKSANGKQ